MSNMKLHIISQGSRWAVRKAGSKRALKLHLHREQAYYHAKSYGLPVIVHNEDGTVLFQDK